MSGLCLAFALEEQLGFDHHLEQFQHGTLDVGMVACGYLVWTSLVSEISDCIEFPSTDQERVHHHPLLETSLPECVESGTFLGMSLGRVAPPAPTTNAT